MIEADRPDLRTETAADGHGTRATRVIRPSDEAAGARKVEAFAWLAAVVDRATQMEVRPESPESIGEPVMVVHARPADPEGPRARLRRGAIEGFERAEASHRETIAKARRRWLAVRDQEQRVADVAEEAARALAVLEAIRERRKGAERELRRARGEAEAASRQELVTSRLLEDARYRAERV